MPNAKIEIRWRIVVCCFVFVSLATFANGQQYLSDFRIWTTAQGRSSDVRLRLIERTATLVKLQREDDSKIATLAIKTLSKEDQAFLKSLSMADSVSSPKSTTPKSESMQSASGLDSDSKLEEWPGWRGVARDGMSLCTGLLKQWPDGGPKLLWTIQGLGEGYSSPSVVEDQIFVLGTKGNQEVLFCLQREDGEPLWQATMGQNSGGGGYPGPRSTPTIDENLAYAIGSDGTLVCVDIKNGSTRWRKNLHQDFGGRCGHWSYAESPLVDANRLIFTPGGNRSTVAAVNKLNGNTLWIGSAAELSNGDDSDNSYTTAAYSSPIVEEVDSVRQSIHFLRGGLVAFSVEDGTPLWHYDAPANDTANCPTPVFADRSVFAASGYGTGGGKATVTRRGRVWNVEEQFFVSRFTNHHGGFVLYNGFLYGANDSTLLCVDWDSGEIRWQHRCVGKGSVSLADGMLYVRSERGPIALVEATPEAYRLLGQFDQPQRSDKQAWPHPVIAHGKLYLRDWDRMFCYDLKSDD
ncbi:outer membrane biogenesis protein BamB [Planctomycetes bacterium CA13]|uniref:Outer membrane biogenesis protein BamB n=1 Tax=Novipirellula herctigrandis TaxID=2527986 RepID=A0A5C5YW94_9BACT|nr:outer membrane biogenesis protein BamB [Planctomycetes bacterium CA13]